MQKEFNRQNFLWGIKTSFARIWKLDKKETLFVIGASLLLSVIEGITPYIHGRFIDALTNIKILKIGGIAVDSSYLIISLWFLVLIIQFILSRVKQLRALELLEKTRLNFIIAISTHILHLPVSFYKENKVGELIEKIARGAQGLYDTLNNIIVQTFPQFIMVIISMIALFWISPPVGALALVGISIFSFFTIREVGPTAALQRQSQKEYAKTRGIAVDAITNLRVVKDFAAEVFEQARLTDGYFNKAMVIWYQLRTIQRNIILFQQLTITTTRFIMFILSIVLLRNGSVTIGEVVAFNIYIVKVFDPIMDLSNNWRTIQNGIIAFEDVETILKTPQEKYLPTNSRDISGITGPIEFKNVSFGYSENSLVLKDISFLIDPGQSIALVGESGVGKSTLSDLILGYYFPNSGKITIDGTPTDEIQLESLRKNIGMVSQEITLFNESIRYNLAYANLHRSEDEILEAARKAHCTDFILKFPEKWQQVVGERGLKLSVGQKQRVAIARAILKDPKILILDEPTSALDAGSEKIVTDALETLMKGRTTIIIAHRLSTVRKVDKILVFKNGEIVEQGNHAELSKKEGGEYKRLYDLQIGLHG